MQHCPCHLCELERAIAKLQRAIAGGWMSKQYRREVRARLVKLLQPEEE